MRTLLVALTLCLGCTHMSAPADFRTIELSSEQPEKLSSHIVFDSPVGPMSVVSFLSELEEREKAGQKVIVVELDTPGGSVGAGMVMSKAIERSPATIICVVDGIAASMGLYILQSCDVRIMTRRSLLMGHEPSSGMVGQPTQLEDLASLLRRLSQAMAHHIAARTTLTVSEYLEKIANGHELWMTVEEALAWRFVDLDFDSVEQVVQQADLANTR